MLSPPTPNAHLLHPKYRPDIDGLRALAVLSVVGFHAFPGYVKGGFVGVDVFFVISGYLISSIILGSLDQGNFSFLEFYARRVRRIFPALIVVLLTCFGVGWFVLLPDEYKQLGKHIAGGAGFVSNLVLWGESGYFDTAAESKPLLHLWSLGVEEQFYIFWPLVLYLGWKMRLSRFTLIVLIAGGSFWLNVSQRHIDPVAMFYSPLTRFWELLIGAMLAYVTLHPPRLAPVLVRLSRWLDYGLGRMIFYPAPEQPDGRILRNIVGLVGLGMIGWSIIGLNKSLAFPGYWALLPTVGAFLVIAAGHEAWSNRMLLSNRLAVWIGLISYPLYLWHWVFLSFARIIESEMPALEVRIAIVLISIALAWITYVFIEKPIRHSSNFLIKNILIILMGIVILCATAVYFQADLNYRLPKPLRELYSWNNFARVGECTLQWGVSEHGKKCYENEGIKILLWGDSHAAALSPGFIKLQKKERIALNQLTQAGCPPIFKVTFNQVVARPDCDLINERILAELKAINPNVIIVHSAWWLRDYKFKDRALFGMQVRETLEKIKANNNSVKVIVIGPTPRWQAIDAHSLIKQWRNPWRSKNLDSEAPKAKQLIELSEIDEILSVIATELDIKYISAIKELCENQDCIYQVGPTLSDAITFDGEHMSKTGSEYFIEKIKSRFL